ncbi:MAG: class I SAM-dependent methyltransferase [Acidobacteriia bacterium]|nr:class I SAM-dependent methyltransferase [Terriglobia bacterium]
MASIFTEKRDVFACPACGGGLCWGGEQVKCEGCNRSFSVEEEIPRFFHPHDPGDKRDVTEIVKAFYETNPFPNYDDLDSRESLAAKARRGIFARLLDEQIARDSLVLEVGCGTGQLTNFLGMAWGRRVFGGDVCLNSLRLAEGFRSRYAIENAAFLQMNLFRPAFRPASFDLVVSNGVLHHTGDPRGAFDSIARLVKPGGHIIIGLYNKIGRLTTDLRRHIFNAFGDRWSALLDGHMRNRGYNKARRRAWFMDQYKHPRESKHSYDEVMDWFESQGFDFLFSIPKIGPAPFEEGERLFVPHGKGSHAGRILTQVDMLVRGGVDGALFIMIGRKRGQR